jgi:hypothetical protein
MRKWQRNRWAYWTRMLYSRAGEQFLVEAVEVLGRNPEGVLMGKVEESY